MHKERGQRGQRFGKPFAVADRPPKPRHIVCETSTITTKDETHTVYHFTPLIVIHTPEIPTCLICGIHHKNVRYVRDHDHSNGMVRGVLCDNCNAYLGIYEAREKLGKSVTRSGRFRGWVDAFKFFIDLHLLRNTNILYINKPKKFRRFCSKNAGTPRSG